MRDYRALLRAYLGREGIGASMLRAFAWVASPIPSIRRAPEVFTRFFARHGIDAGMVPLRVPATRLEATLRALLDSPTVGGVPLSIPHKRWLNGCEKF